MFRTTFVSSARIAKKLFVGLRRLVPVETGPWTDFRQLVTLLADFWRYRWLAATSNNPSDEAQKEPRRDDLVKFWFCHLIYWLINQYEAWLTCDGDIPLAWVSANAKLD